MAASSDKSRFYLEKSVSELQELRRKQIFTQHEISCIVKRRSDFEHKINGRHSHASDYTKYAAYEMNIESLLQKRTKRLGAKPMKFSGQRNVFFVLERATRKFHGDKGLWMQYLNFARRQKSNKKVSEILTQMLRLFPTEPDVWIYAANYALEVRGDMSGARVFMQKGLRLCKRSEEMWVEYARLELIQIARLAARNKILGLDGAKKQEDQGVGSEEDTHASTFENLGAFATEEDGADERTNRDPQAGLEKIGAIPIAIFDAALEEIENRFHLAWTFFDMVAEIDVGPRGAILSHVMDCMQSIAPSRVETLIRSVRRPIIGVDSRSSEYPASLGVSLDKYYIALDRLESMPCRRRFHESMEDWITETINVKGLDDDIRKVLGALLKKTQNELRTTGSSYYKHNFHPYKGQGPNIICEISLKDLIF